ncbi:MAG: hypothetical protein QOF70_4846 [Acetobacteraceae bacterium]|jgi:hypothetical protein|nr:hypothetical protein [Acetobacteraceae bacterium]
MPARTERYRFVPFEIEDVNAIPQTLLGGYADVTRGGGMTFERWCSLDRAVQAAQNFTSRRGT